MYFESQQEWEKEVDKDFKDAKILTEETLKVLNQFSE